MATGTIQKPNVVWAKQYTATLASSSFTISDDAFTADVCAVVTPEYDGSMPLNSCCTAQIIDGGVGNRRLNVYVRTGAGAAVTGTHKFNVIIGHFS